MKNNYINTWCISGNESKTNFYVLTNIFRKNCAVKFK